MATRGQFIAKDADNNSIVIDGWIVENDGSEPTSGQGLAQSTVQTDSSGENQAYVDPGGRASASAQSSSTNTTQVDVETSSTSVLAANTSRVACTLFWPFGASQVVYILAGSGDASETAYTCALQPGGSYNLPCAYQGEISAIVENTPGENDVLMVTEYV